MAAGLTIRPAAVPEFRAFLCSGSAARWAPRDGRRCVEIDALVTPGGGGRRTVDDFQRLAPFGPGNPEPMFALPTSASSGRGRCRAATCAARWPTPAGGLNAVAWRIADTELGRRLMAGGGALHVAGRLKRR